MCKGLADGGSTLRKNFGQPCYSLNVELPSAKSALLHTARWGHPYHDSMYRNIKQQSHQICFTQRMPFHVGPHCHARWNVRFTHNFPTCITMARLLYATDTRLGSRREVDAPHVRWCSEQFGRSSGKNLNARSPIQTRSTRCKV